jgi:Domain of unknown function (DUF4124)
MISIKFIATCAISSLALGALSFSASAQQMYRIVGPDGKVTFSDQPPPTAANAKVTAGRTGRFTGDGPTGNTTIPAELRPVATRYPVTLYTGKTCGAPCDSARGLLTARGIPFAEKTIESNEDIDSLRRLMGDASLPSATIGSQQLKGFSDQEWTQYLDAAAYPKASVLPANFRNPAPTPMVARAPAAAPAPAAEAAPAAAPARAAAPAPANPAGIKF